MIFAFRESRKITIIALFCFFAGLACYAFYNNWIIIYMPNKKQEITSFIATKKEVTFWLIKNNEWQKETKKIILSSDLSQALYTTLELWLTLLVEENSGVKLSHIEAVSLSGSGSDLYISFDRSPLSKGSSTHEKLLWVEGLLKTVRANDNRIQAVHFLVHHQPLVDSTLDFSYAWPIGGFIEV